MRIAAKLTFVLTLVVLVVLATNAITRLRREGALFEQDMQRDHHRMGRGLGNAVVLIWEDVGEDRALWLIEQANRKEGEILIRWVWFDAPPGDPYAPTAPTVRLPLGMEETTWITRETEPDRLYTYVPLEIDGEARGGLEISESLAQQKAYIRQSRSRLAMMTLAVLGSSTLVVMGLGGLLVGRPAQQLIEQARRIGGGDLRGRLDMRQRDELGEIAVEMNAMCDRLADARDRVEQASRERIEALEQLRQADRLRTIGQLASGIAHELGTPLNVVSGRASMIATGEIVGDEALDSARIIGEQADRMTRIIRQLLDFARGRRPEKEAQDIWPIVDRTMTLLAPLARKRSSQLLAADRNGPVVADVDASQLQQVLTNLFVNGLDAMPHGGTVQIRAEHRHVEPPAHIDRPSGRYAVISVQDEGTGIEPDHVERVFDPFFSTKGVGEGTGLGLSVSYGIVAEHGGWIAVDSVARAGSTFTVYLPVA